MQTVMKRILSNGFPSTSSSWRRQFNMIRLCRRQFDLISSWRPWRRPFKYDQVLEVVEEKIRHDQVLKAMEETVQDDSCWRRQFDMIRSLRPWTISSTALRT